MPTVENDELILSLDNVSVHYGPVSALRHASIGVSTGSIVTILGANGAGKSTLLKSISGLVKASNGRISYRGKDITRLAPSDRVRQGISHCPEGRRIFSALTVRQNLVLGGHLLDKSDLDSGLDRALKLFPVLADRLNQSAGSMSGGEQQMLAIGRSLMSNPRLLLLDEPSLGLAPLIIHRVFEVLAEIREQGTTVVVVEQNVSQALRLADYAYVLSSGQIDLSGTASEIMSTDAVRRSYLGG